jgi:hypothetical protein
MKLSAGSLSVRTFQLFLFLFINTVFAQSVLEASADVNFFKRVLLVKDDSYLENAVGKILKDTLTQKGFVVKTIKQSALTNENSGAYRAIIIFNAVKSSGLSAPERQFMNASGRAQTNVLISSVYGQPWDKNKQSVDAVASATKNLNPEKVAATIIDYVNSIIERDMGPLSPDSVK